MRKTSDETNDRLVVVTEPPVHSRPAAAAGAVEEEEIEEEEADLAHYVEELEEDADLRGTRRGNPRRR